MFKRKLHKPRSPLLGLTPLLAKLCPLPAPRPLPAAPRFLVIRLDNLGDGILNTPLYRELKRNFPGCHITAIVKPPMAALLEVNPSVDCVLKLRYSSASNLPISLQGLLAALGGYWRYLRGKHFDAALLPRWDFDFEHATLLALLSRAPIRMGYSEKTTALKQGFNPGYDRCLTHVLAPGPVRHEVLRSLALVEALGGTVTSSTLDIPLASWDRSWAKQALTAAPPGALLLALGIGANDARLKEWPIERFADAITALRRNHPERPICAIVPGILAEKSRAEELLQIIGEPVLLFLNQTTTQTTALFEHCHLFLGNDSGLAHIAAALSVPTVVITAHAAQGKEKSSDIPYRFAPWTRHRRILQPAAPTDPCYTDCLGTQPHCILQVTVEEAVQSMEELLEITADVKH